MTPLRRIRPFTPGAEPAERLEARTVGRDAVLDLISDRLKAAATTRNRPHTLVVGPRGSGKSHVIEVALHRVARTELASRLTVVTIDEDAVGITRTSDLLVEVLRAMGAPVPDAPDRLRSAVSAAMDGRVLVLVLHNLDRIFHSMGLAGQRDFRSWVENSGDIMVLATSPQLFPGVRDHAKPWYNNFGVSHLDGLTVAEGRDLLERLAREYGDDALAEFIATDDGEARLKAVHAVAGGSPRVWMILSECLTVEVLDDLVLAVEGLLEGLVPYYQQLLWELSGNEQRLVRALAEGPNAAATVTELATAAGIEQRSVATTLGRLSDMRWVVAEKAPGLDRRTSWYRLAEPLLRHHLQYRAAGRQPLPLIVELLRAVHEPSWRESELVNSLAGSEAERLLAQSFVGDERIFDYAWASRYPDDLLVEARRWINGGDADRRTVRAGTAIESSVLSARAGTLKPVLRDGTDAAFRDIITNTLRGMPADLGEEERIGVLLDALADATEGRDGDVLGLVAAGWNSRVRGWAEGDTRAAGIVLPDDDPLGMDVAALRGKCLALVSGQAGLARELLLDTVPRLARTRGPNHPDTMHAQSWAGVSAWILGEYAVARTELADVHARQERVLGKESRETQSSLETLAECVGAIGRPAEAVQLWDRVISVESELYGPYATTTIMSRIDRARWIGEAGDPRRASAELLDALENLDRATGEFEQRLRDRARQRLRLNLFLLARTTAEMPGIPPAGGNAPTDLIELVHEALQGSAAARVRLPSELLGAVDELSRDEAAPRPEG